MVSISEQAACAWIIVQMLLAASSEIGRRGYVVSISEQAVCAWIIVQMLLAASSKLGATEEVDATPTERCPRPQMARFETAPRPADYLRSGVPREERAG